MIAEVKIPVLAESVPDATLLAWNKQPGEWINEGEILVEVETDKVVLEVPAPASGVLKAIVKNEGDTALSEEVIATIDTEATRPAGADEPAGAGESVPTPAAVEADAGSAQAQAPIQVSTAALDGLSPAVRRIVVENQLDPNSIEGTGKGGRLTKADVLASMKNAPLQTAPPAQTSQPAAANSAPPAPTTQPGDRTERREPMSRLRARIAERLVDAQQTAAILTTFNEVNMGPVMALRNRYKEQFEQTHGVRLGFMSFFVKAAIQALQRYPAVNAYIEGSDIVYHDYYDVGVAVGSPRGLVVPIVRDADRLSFAGIEQQIGHYSDKAQSGQLGIGDLTGGTFTISNGGVFGSMLSTPILNPPQSAILGMHKTTERPVVENGEIVVRPVMYLALSYDHRIIDGREAVLFLVTIKEAIEDPARLLLEV